MFKEIIYSAVDSLIKRVGCTYKYYLTRFGQTVVACALRFGEHEEVRRVNSMLDIERETPVGQKRSKIIIPKVEIEHLKNDCNYSLKEIADLKRCSVSTIRRRLQEE